jgi:uncharacterized membrane protein YebE (DUF533 family)
VDIYELAALRLYLVVGMAASDGHIDENERAQLASFVEDCGVSDEHRSSLRQMLARLYETPPALDTLLRGLVDRFEGSDYAHVLVADLISIASADGVIDPREEGFIRLVCGALNIDPISLYGSSEQAASDVSREELASMVRGLLGMEAA